MFIKILLSLIINQIKFYLSMQSLVLRTTTPLIWSVYNYKVIITFPRHLRHFIERRFLFNPAIYQFLNFQTFKKDKQKNL